MLRVMTIIGTRPEIIRLSEIIKVLDRDFDHMIVHTGQNYDYELNEIFFSGMKIREPNFYLGAAGSNAAESIGNIITKTDKLIEETRPEAVLILGDTNSALAAIAVKKRRIPLFHLEAGNRSFDQRVPEEVNRKIVDHISDINMTYSQIARECLIREGLPSDRVIKIGSPLYEVISAQKKQIFNSKILNKLGLSKLDYYLISAHREENVDDKYQLTKILNIINDLASQKRKPVIFSTHPRTKKKINALEFDFHPLVKLMKPLGFHEYLNLQIHSKAVLSDSGSITEESSVLNFPALNIREVQERHEGMEETAVMMVGLDKKRIFQGLNVLESQERNNKRTINLVKEYGVPNVSEKVSRIILSYTDYINKFIWFKQST